MIKLVKTNGLRLASVKYTIKFAEGERRDGTTDPEGMIEEKDVPAGRFLLTIPNESDDSEEPSKQAA